MVIFMVFGIVVANTMATTMATVLTANAQRLVIRVTIATLPLAIVFLIVILTGLRARIAVPAIIATSLLVLVSQTVARAVVLLARFVTRALVALVLAPLEKSMSAAACVAPIIR